MTKENTSKTNKRNKKGFGHLFKRAKIGKDGKPILNAQGEKVCGPNYYIEYQAIIDGKRIRKVERLVDENGKPITNLRKAEKRAARLTEPFRATTEADKRRALADAAAREEDKARKTQEATRHQCEIDTMWDQFPYDTNHRGNTERKLSAGTIKENQSLWKKFTEWAKEEKIQFADEITPAKAKKFQRYLHEKKNLSGDRINKIIMACKVMFRLAGFEETPFDDFRKLEHKPKGRRDLTEAELRNVCGKASGELRTLLAIGLYTGLRLGDASRLQWDEIASDLSKIIREPSKLAYKTDSELVIPVHRVLAAILSETPKSSRKGFVLPELGALYQSDKAALSKMIQDHFDTCGIQTQKKDTGFITVKDEDGNLVEKHSGIRAVVEVGFHSLRHSFVSICAKGQVPLHVVQALCGHSSPEIQRRYLHHSNDDSSKAIATLPSIGEEYDADAAEYDDRKKLAEFAEKADIKQVRKAIKVFKK